MTGRRIILDTYGGWGGHRSSAFSSKNYINPSIVFSCIAVTVLLIVVGDNLNGKLVIVGSLIGFHVRRQALDWDVRDVPDQVASKGAKWVNGRQVCCVHLPTDGQIHGERRIEQTMSVAAFIRDRRLHTPVCLLRCVEQGREARWRTTSRTS